MTCAYEDVPRQVREMRRRATRARAEWAAIAAETVGSGDVSGIVRQLRRRGQIAANRARGLFALLVVVILLGLGFYLLLPFWQQFSDSRKATLDQQVAFIDIRLEEQDGERNAIRDKLVEFLKLVPREVRTGTGEPLNPPAEIGGALFVTGWQGTILRSTDGETWEEVRTGTGEPLYPPVEIGGTLFVTGGDGTILRSTDGETWEEVRARTGEPLNPPAEIGGTLFVTGGDGTILRSTDGETWEEVRARTGEPLNPPAEIGGTLFVTGSRGTLLRSTDGETWVEVRTGTGERLNRPVEIGGTLFVTGWQGTILRSTDGETWEEVRTGTGEPLNPPAEIGGALFVTGWQGTLLRSTDGETWEEVRTGTGEGLFPPAEIGGTLFVTGREGTILRSTDGETWEEVRAGTGEGLNPLAEIGGTLFVTGRDGTLLRFDNGWSDQVTSLPLESGSIGDSTLLDFLREDLPPGIRSIARVSALTEQTENVIVLRRGLMEVREGTEAQREKLDELPWALQLRRDRQLLYEDFLKACRTVNAVESEELTKICLETWNASQRAEQNNWWQTLAQQVPPGILLLFLLATLGGLYRYNMRLAGFHHSRADLLELLFVGREAGAPLTKEELETAVALSDSLAADKVAFGKANTPTDQAIEMMKAVLAHR